MSDTRRYVRQARGRQGQLALVLVLCFGVALGAAGFPTRAAAQISSEDAGTDSWTAPTTPWGDPDLQGIWDYRTLTPLQRPEEFADRTVATEEEAAEYETRANAVRDARTTVHAVWWLDYGRELTSDRRTSLIIDPPDGRIPETTEAAKARAGARRERAQQHPAAGPTFRSLTERCINFGMPPVPGPYNNNYLIVQTPDHVVLFSEMIHDARIVALDGRDRPADDVRLWSGVARGHWEGDTLVVVSTHFSDRAAPRGSTAGLRLEERLTRVGPETIRYSATLTDPETWTRPWTFAMPMTRTDQPPYEYACHEGNYGLRNILHNARYAEDPDYLSKLPSPPAK
ncbi:MAG: hypothetical protein F4W89_16060 [Acidobacteria bacterium]|nr:hypothetical protein [Acidobacteriota bacterium]